MHAEEDSQRYKIGKYILETKRIVKGSEWIDRDDHDDGGRIVDEIEEHDLEFDSQDDEECEDLFSGIWTPQLARRRRKNRDFGKR